MKKTILFSLVISLTTILCYGQSITPSNEFITVCPKTSMFYSADPGSDFSDCGDVSWTITNGSFKKYSVLTTTTTKLTESVEVFWDDVTSKGTLMATSICSDKKIFKARGTYIIRSVVGQTPQGITILEGTPLPMCSTQPRSIKVDRVSVPNTGDGTNSILRYDADGYEWEFSESSNWTGANSSELITAIPNNLCAGGTIKVRAYINTCGDKSYSNFSTALNLRDVKSYNVTAPNGTNAYTHSCGNTGSVTFTVPKLSCASAYKWNFPSAWFTDGGAASGVTTRDPTITLVLPAPGTAKASIEGALRATATTGSCSFQYGDLTLSYSDEPLPKPVFTGPSIKNLCSNSTGTIAISPITGALNYTWYTVPETVGFYTGNITLNDVTASATTPLIIPGTSVTVKSPILTTNKYGVDVFVKANRVGGCAGSPLSSTAIWVGPPPEAHQYNLYVTGYRGVNPVTLQQEGLYTFQMDKTDGATSYAWSLPTGFSFFNGQSSTSSQIQAWTPAASGSFSLMCSPQNICGSTGAQTLTIKIYGIGGIGTPCPHPPCSIGPQPARMAYPNPVNGDNVSVDANPEYSVIDLYNSNGQKLKSGIGNGDKIDISTEGLPNGVYFLRIKDADNKITVKEILIKK